MAKQSTKERIIIEGARIVHEKGFNNTGIHEILQAANVPKGSFYFYFASKEEFGLNILDYHNSLVRQWMAQHLEESGLSPLASLRAFFEGLCQKHETTGCHGGCPIGNLAQEMADLSDAFRAKAEEALTAMRDTFARCLEAARQRGEIDPTTDPLETADFLLNSWEGALLRMKAHKDVKALEIFCRTIFGRVLKE